MSTLLSELEKHMLEAVADLHGIPAGAYNIRRNGEGAARQSTEHIQINPKTDKPGIDLWSFSKLIDIFLEARNRKEGTILVISHQEKILEMADQIVLVVDGEVTHIGQRDEVLPHLLMKGDCDLKCLFRKGSVID